MRGIRAKPIAVATRDRGVAGIRRLPGGSRGPGQTAKGNEGAPKLEEAARAPLPMATVIPDNPVPPDPTWYVVGGAVVLLLSLLPFTPLDRHRPLALRPALVALAPARPGPVTG